MEQRSHGEVRPPIGLAVVGDGEVAVVFLLKAILVEQVKIDIADARLQRLLAQLLLGSVDGGFPQAFAALDFGDRFQVHRLLHLIVDLRNERGDGGDGVAFLLLREAAGKEFAGIPDDEVLLVDIVDDGTTAAKTVGVVFGAVPGRRYLLDRDVEAQPECQQTILDDRDNAGAILLARLGRVGIGQKAQV